MERGSNIFAKANQATKQSFDSATMLQMQQNAQ
jgi:hypothetical protein